MTIHLDTLTLTVADDLPLRIDVRHDSDVEARALVVIAHGFKGFRRWGFFPHVGERLATAGFVTAVVDFSMNGVGDDPVEFTRLDLFRRNTLSREADELEVAIDALREHDALPEIVRSRPFGLLGHSRGAVATMTSAVERPDAVGAVVTWNGVSRALRYTEGQLGRWEEDGEMGFTNARTGQRMAMAWNYVVDAREHAGRLEPIQSAGRMKAPHLIVHGTKDMAVALDEAHQLKAGHSDADGCELVEIEGGTHTFGAVHPFAGSTPQLDRALDVTTDWYGRHLAGGHA